MTTHSGDFVSGLQDAIRQNPVSAALIGMGVLWMFTGGSRITAAAALLSPAARATATGIGSGFQSATNAAGAAGEGLRSATARVADTMRETVADVSASVSNTASQAYDAVTGAVTDTTSAGKDNLCEPAVGGKDNLHEQAVQATGFASTLQGNLKDTFERQPLLLGAIGLALGAGMAAAVPPTRLETEYAGDAAERVTAQVKEFASAQVDRVSAAAERTLQAVKDEAAAQGLTPQAAKEGVVAIGGRIKTAAKAARNPRT